MADHTLCFRAKMYQEDRASDKEEHLVLLPSRAGCGLQKPEAHAEEGAVGFYREI